MFLTCHLFLIFAFVGSCLTQQLVLIRNPPPLDVTIGMTAALSKRHLVIQNKASNGDLCRVEVDDNEPASLMVGRLEPKKFDCFFDDGAVTYHHEGSPLTSEDRIKFSIYYFWRNNSIVDTAWLPVRVDLKPDFKVFEQRADIEVKTSKAISTPISSDILRFRYDPSVERCTVSFATLRQRGRRGDRGPWLATRKWPAIGRVVSYRKRVVNAFDHDCQQMLLMGYRYEHRKPGSPDVDFIPLTVRVQQKGAAPFKERRESLFLRIAVRNAAPNQPPRLTLRPVQLTNSGGTLEPIPPHAIALAKDESRAKFLVVNVTSLSGSAPARLVNMRDPSRAVTSFTYADFKERKIRFQILEYSPNATSRYQLGLQAIDGYLATSEVAFLRVRSQLLGGGPCQYFNRPIATYTRAATKVKADNFQVLGFPSCRAHGVSYRVRDNPKNGALLVGGQYSKLFSAATIVGAGVVYKPTNFAAETDAMTVEAISSRGGERTGVAKLDVAFHIVRLHDRRSALRPRSDFAVSSKGFVCLDTSILERGAAQLLERDRVDLQFDVLSQPRQGFLALTVGRPPRRAPARRLRFFSLQDLRLRRLCYRHTSWDVEQFTVAQRVQSQPAEGARIALQPAVITIRADSAPMASLRDHAASDAVLVVPETASSKNLTARYLSFRSQDVRPKDILFRITTFPRFRDANETVDAGRLLNRKDLVQNTDNGDMPTKSTVKDLKRAQIGTLVGFSQEDVDRGDVVYVPPLNDIGVTDREVRLEFRVSTRDGHRLSDRVLKFLVKAEDDKPPRVDAGTVEVKRGSSHVFSQEEIRVSDIDTRLRDVMVEVKKLPAHGRLIDDRGRTMLTGYRFPATRFRESKIKYQNDGKNYKSDFFNVTVSDGPRTSNVTVVRLNITDYDWNLNGWKAYVNNSIQVRENSSMVILDAVFPHPPPEVVVPDERIIYYIYENPVKGHIMFGDGVVSQFTLQDVRRKLIRYNHTSGEIGAVTVYDFARVSMHINGQEPSGARKINFSINPVNSQAPQVFIGSSLIITEGRDTHAIVGYNTLAVVDRDTDERRIKVRVIKKPMHGLIKVAGRQAYDFSMAQIREGQVRYVQKPESEGLEETEDQFSVVANDGQFFSGVCKVQVGIILGNDETPRLTLNNFSVKPGGKQVLDRSILEVTDADRPRDNVQILVSKKPRKGDIFLVYHASKERLRVSGNRNVFALNMMGRMDVVYEHRRDSKGADDSFELTVSDRVHVVKKTCHIRVEGKKGFAPVLMASQPLLIFHDVMGALTERQLSAVDTDTPSRALVYRLVSAPTKGQVVRAGENVDFLPRSAFRSSGNLSTPVFATRLPIEEGATFTQEEVSRGKIAYMYLGRSRERVRDAFSVVLSDGQTALKPRTVVTICDNPPPHKQLSMEAKWIRVQRAGSVALRPRHILIKNSLTPVDRLKVEVAQMARCGSIIDTKADRRASLTSFLYNDLHDTDRLLLSVRDCPPDVNHLAIALVVNDMSSRAETLLRVNITRPPVVTRFMRLAVKQSQRATIGPDTLKTSDSDTPPDRIVYIVVRAPERGILVKRGAEVMRGENFTQADVNQRRIAYHNFKGPGVDSIGLNVTDGDSSTYVFASRAGRQGVLSLQIKIDPVAKNLVAVYNVAPTKLEKFGRQGYGFRFSPANIQANFPNVTRFVVRRQPTFGQLRLRGREVGLVREFSDLQLKAGALMYMMKPRSKVMTNDSFAYTLQVKRQKDAGQYTTNGQVYTMNLIWSKVQFVKKRYRVCEGRGFLKIRILRVGYLQSKSTVRVKYQTRWAKTPRDFLPSSTDPEIKFEEGQKESIYKVQVTVGKKDRKSNRKKKKVIFILHSNDNALLGDFTRVTVVMKEGRKCRQDRDFITPEQNEQEKRLEEQRKRKSKVASNSESQRQMLQDIRIPSDEELRRQALKKHNVLIPDLPPNEELRKYEKNYMSITELSQVPHDGTTPNEPCNLEKLGMILLYKGKEFVCEGLQERWIPLKDINKEMPRCEKGWVLNTGRCYRHFDIPMDWNGAEASCKLHKAMLAAPASMERQTWITEKVSRKRKFWIGLHFSMRRMRWQYTDLSTPNFSRWNRRRPSLRQLRRKRARRCVMVSPFFTWCPRRCSGAKHMFGFVCEKPAT